MTIQIIKLRPHSQIKLGHWQVDLFAPFLNLALWAIQVVSSNQGIGIEATLKALRKVTFNFGRKNSFLLPLFLANFYFLEPPQP
jgi:hypothetical protein